MHLGFPISDAVTGLFGAISILSAMQHRLKNPDSPGQEIDLSATEAMFRLLDFYPIEYDQLGIVRQRSGNANQVAGPSSVYQSKDGHWATISAAVPSIFERLAHLMGQPELLARSALRDQRQARREPRCAERHRLGVDNHQDAGGVVRNCYRCGIPSRPSSRSLRCSPIRSSRRAARSRPSPIRTGAGEDADGRATGFGNAGRNSVVRDQPSVSTTRKSTADGWDYRMPSRRRWRGRRDLTEATTWRSA